MDEVLKIYALTGPEDTKLSRRRPRKHLPALQYRHLHVDWQQYFAEGRRDEQQDHEYAAWLEDAKAGNNAVNDWGRRSST